MKFVESGENMSIIDINNEIKLKISEFSSDFTDVYDEKVMVSIDEGSNVFINKEKNIEDIAILHKKMVVIENIDFSNKYHYNVTKDVIVQLFDLYKGYINESSSDISEKKEFLKLAENLMKSFKLSITGIDEIFRDKDDCLDLYVELFESMSVKKSLENFVGKYLNLINKKVESTNIKYIIIFLKNCYIDKKLLEREININLLANNLVVIYGDNIINIEK